jgi:hypothetical protein
MDDDVLERVSRKFESEKDMLTNFWSAADRPLLNNSQLKRYSKANIFMMLLLPSS